MARWLLRSLLVMAPLTGLFAIDIFCVRADIYAGVSQPAPDAQLVLRDLVTGTILTSSPITNEQALFGALAFVPGEGLYAIDGFNDGFQDRLFRIDPLTGAGMVVGDTGFNWNFRFLDYNQANGVLYGGRDNEFFTFDRTTGLATSLGAVSLRGQLTALAINSAGAAYVTDLQRGLYSVDLATPALSLLGTVPGTGDFSDLAFDENDVLYGTTGSVVQRIDIATLTATTLFSAADESLAFVPVPEPSAIALLGLGAIVVAAFNRQPAARHGHSASSC